MMPSTHEASSVPNTLLLFGPKVPTFNSDYFDWVHRATVRAKEDQWILDVVKDLIVYWDTIRQEIPFVDRVPGGEQLQCLLRWLQSGMRGDWEGTRVPNAILCPLVVIGHLVELSQYSASLHDGAETDRMMHAVPGSRTETLGFCLGILSAIVASCSLTRATFRRHGGAAIRLALVIGAIVDAQDSSDAGKQSISLAATWKPEQSLTTVEKVIHDFPDAYISVSYDHNRAIVTTSQSTVPALKRRFEAAGITTNETSLYGRFHTPLHEGSLQALLSFCERHPSFELPDASSLALPTRLNEDGHRISQDNLHVAAVRSILVDRCSWVGMFQATSSDFLFEKESRVVSFGYERCVPPSILRALDAPVRSAQDILGGRGTATNFRETDVAVIGMACQVAGAEDLEQFWNLILEGQSQHREGVDSGRKWYGNLIDRHDTFDHKFFKKSPREAASMDPQQRLLYQAAYQAVAQSGYFQNSGAGRESQIGCFVGICTGDYEDNVSHYAPNAFSSTGTLRAFAAGRLSHYFGWTGPGMTIDTACSSSAVAIHQAIQSILSGECSAALAGGTNLITSPLGYQNLAAASFLSPTGQCKPFDAKADGYCRGEAVGAIFLKKLSQAIADGDQILGVISGTAVRQNQNCTPVFVPNVPSLSELFEAVVHKSGLDPNHISYVEAHGTGTAVGDPAEYQSIRQVFGRRSGPIPVQIGSIKGLVGHTEASSGVVALIKTILMMHNLCIPPQASFSALNPSISASPYDNIHIALKAIPWQEDFKVALINNYGASGSNASMVVKQAPYLGPISSPGGVPSASLPFYITALDDKTLRAYATKLRNFIKYRAASGQTLELESVCFNMARQSNWSLERSLIFSCRSVEQLEQKLAMFERGDAALQSMIPPAQRPVILCFGGQVSTFIGLDRQVFENNKVLRDYLNECDAICQSLSASSIYPAIFQREAIDDVSQLQSALFAMQYSCAMSWIACGVNPVALIGHSFGELTALCVSGTLSLKDSLRMIITRSNLIKQSWGAETGAMMAVESDHDVVEAMLKESHRLSPEGGASIACFNGPRSFTLAGSVAAIDAIEHCISTQLSNTTTKHKRLNVRHAFHSSLVDSLRPELEQLGQSMSFNKPRICLERATKQKSDEITSGFYIYNHMRQPVYFHQAARRLYEQYPSAIWLEAGSNSTIASMANRALETPKHSTFQSVNITTGQALDQLTETTLSLWRAGLPVTFWAHSRAQSYHYAPILLPPYQFEQSRHWLEYKSLDAQISARADVQGKVGMKPENPLTTLYSFVGFQDAAKTRCRFRINTLAEEYKDILSAHVIVKTASICPATVQIGIVVEAIASIHRELRNPEFRHQIRNVKNHSPMCINPSRMVFLDLERTIDEPFSWTFRILGTDNESVEGQVHTTGAICFLPQNDDQYIVEFDRFRRLFEHQRCTRLLDGEDVEDVIQGRSIYKIFSDIKLVGKENESAGRVVKSLPGDKLFDPFLSDCFCQVGGIWVNCLSNSSSADMFIASGFEQWTRSPRARKHDDAVGHGQKEKKGEWHVLAHHTKSSSGAAFTTDIFVFDPTSGELMEIILGVIYTKVPKASMATLLSRPEMLLSPAEEGHQLPIISTTDQDGADIATGRSDLLGKLKAMLADITGMQPEEIHDNVNLPDIGIDSLMGMEMAHEIRNIFGCTLAQDELMLAIDLPALLDCLSQALGMSSDDESAKTPPSNDDGFELISPSGKLAGVDTFQEAWELDSSDNLPKETELELSASDILGAFRDSKSLTDRFITDHQLLGYFDRVMPEQTRLCIVLIIEAFGTLGCDLSLATVGQELPCIHCRPQHGYLLKYLYSLLQEARIINLDTDRIIRTELALPSESSTEILKSLLRDFPDHKFANELLHWTGSRLADVLLGNTDGVKLIFGTEKGRELVAGLYGDYAFNKLSYQQMVDFLNRLVSSLPVAEEAGPLKILEMGAGTGGTTKWLLPALAKFKISVEYTFTDLSASLVGMARKRFKEYPFMKFMVHDIENPPIGDLVNSQHIVIASNAVHATHSLGVSAANMRSFLRPDGFLMLVEMTKSLHWVDMVFGILEGWWLFDDGRSNAIVNEHYWDRELRAAGFGQVEWTDGSSPETAVQRIIIALPSNNTLNSSSPTSALSTGHELRRKATDIYIESTVEGFYVPERRPIYFDKPSAGKSVLVTGGTGSLGCHLVAHFASLPSVHTVYCLNRVTNTDPVTRQLRALEEKKIHLNESAFAKLRVIESDTSNPHLGLPQDQYEDLLHQVTHIIHNGWPMTATRDLRGFESQFTVMRNLIDLAANAVTQKASGEKVSFLFVSSIAAVGHYPVYHSTPHIPEDRMTVDSVLPNGYGDAKFICERILDETLQLHPGLFRAMSVRLGQVSGSSETGYWNPMEHIPFIIKSSQTLDAFPDFQGLVSWTPVNDVAATIADLVLSEAEPHAFYHIDNPARQPWKSLVLCLAEELGIKRILPFREWLHVVRTAPEAVRRDNPAVKMVDFVEQNFELMSCGGVLLDVSNSMEHSETLRLVGPISFDLVRKYIDGWKATGFLR
ncbi:putative polyketide synthase [Thozetella sp. PMI_491]|nr:putative polyketide synthase [Thozetella sp. PMI_491]